VVFSLCNVRIGPELEMRVFGNSFDAINPVGMTLRKVVSIQLTLGWKRKVTSSTLVLSDNSILGGYILSEAFPRLLLYVEPCHKLGSSAFLGRGFEYPNEEDEIFEGLKTRSLHFVHFVLYARLLFS
jgi:hypothetical protein